MGVLWRIELLGTGPRATRGDQVVTRFRSQRVAALLAYLAYYRHRPHPRETLIELLWPESPPEAGRRNLRVELTALRHQLEPPGVSPGAVIAADHATVQLQPGCVTDVAQFEAALQTADRSAGSPDRVRHLVQAVELYQGPLLPGHYEEWIVPERQRLEEQYFQALRQLIAHYEQSGDLDRALRFAHRAVSADPLREEAQHELIRLYAAAGQPQAALRQYHELERLLRQELDTNPGPATLALARSLGERAQGEERGEDSNSQFSIENYQLRIAPPSPPPLVLPSAQAMEPAGGAVPLDSPFYIVRSTDQEFAAAMARRDSIVLVKGTRQVGKTSLLARGLQQARQAGARVVRTDFQMFNADYLASAEMLLFALAQTMADQLDLDVSPASVWNPRRGPNPNFQRFLERQVLGAMPVPLVWALDQVDRLFGCEVGPDLFGMFRSWHNERALDPSGPWSSLTLAIAYTTEAHLFIADGDQSPFNVGTRLTLDDFTREQVADLNRRHGSPLRDEAELARFYHLVGGHPYLVRRGLHEMAHYGIDINAFEARAANGEWIYGAHLRRMLALLIRDSELCDAVWAVLQGRPSPTLESFYYLRSAGVVIGDSEEDARPRCQLYAIYLQRHLR